MVWIFYPLDFEGIIPIKRHFNRLQIFIKITKEFHKNKISERAATEGRKVSFQLTIDDIYAVSTGHLIGRPSYND
jgi:glutamate mutase epsilon subunit